MVRWLYLSGLVFAVLIPAGWQVAPKDLEDLSRYGGWVEPGLWEHLFPLHSCWDPALPLPVFPFGFC